MHGGPGRAGGGEELGGLRSVKHYMQRTAVEGSPTMLATIGQQWVHGAQVNRPYSPVPQIYFEEIQPGDSLLTPRRTLTEADIVNFACLSGDHFLRAHGQNRRRRGRFLASGWSTAIS
ncbi:hypothetical protein LN650_18050 [Klebsiella pneumoniae subsp. pneumoniae]|nr:hypothetical protein [Klebsiella pneumoniae subsp. pneumoniae]